LGATAFAFSASPASPASAAQVGFGRTGRAAGTGAGQEARVVIFRVITDTRLDLSCQVGIDVTFRPFHAGGKEIFSERRVAGTLPLTAGDVAGLSRPIVRAAAFTVSIGLASRLRSPRAATALGIR